MEEIGIVVFAELDGEASHYIAQVAVEWRGDGGGLGDAAGVFGVYHLGTLGRHTPVAVAVAGHYALFAVPQAHMQQPFTHSVVVVADGLDVAEAGVEHIGHGDEGAGPGHIVGVVAPVGGGDVAELAVGPLAVLKVLQPLGVEAVVVEKETLAVAARRAVASPAHTLVALRAVGWHRTVVAADTPVGVAVHSVDDVVVGLEGGSGGHLVVEHQTCEVADSGLAAFRQATDFHVAEAVVDEDECVNV